MKLFDQFIHTNARLEAQLKELESCDPDTLPLLIVTDKDVRIECNHDHQKKTLNYATRQSSLFQYARTLVINHCNEVQVTLPVHNWLPKNASKDMTPTTVELPVVRGIQFWHDNGTHYVYWGWVDSVWQQKPNFSVLLRDQLARQGLYRKTIDNWRIDIQAGRMYNANLLTPTQF